MLMAAFIFVFSLALLGHFAVRYREALRVASAAVTPADFVRASGLHLCKADTEGFRILMSLEELCPALDGDGQGLRAVRIYAHALHGLRRAAARLWPALSSWAETERELCFRYAVACLSQRAARNQQTFAALRSN